MACACQVGSRRYAIEIEPAVMLSDVTPTLPRGVARYSANLLNASITVGGGVSSSPAKPVNRYGPRAGRKYPPKGDALKLNRFPLSGPAPNLCGGDDRR